MRTIVYLHSNKDTMFEKGEELGLKGEALNMFKYALYEVAIEIDINEQSGIVKIIKVMEAS